MNRNVISKYSSARPVVEWRRRMSASRGKREIEHALRPQSRKHLGFRCSGERSIRGREEGHMSIGVQEKQAFGVALPNEEDKTLNEQAYSRKQSEILKSEHFPMIFSVPEAKIVLILRPYGAGISKEMGYVNYATSSWIFSYGHKEVFRPACSAPRALTPDDIGAISLGVPCHGRAYGGCKLCWKKIYFRT
ncbi:uncharacterized protein FOMMEDRAFT_136923 [Fomitiporia mediterranea MF3/22]|uniref:uncharacterized protein n=1 Tax=Fomitiporia mediterranea (strain MF3/22) TaxID=694068 RepID=UPI00044085CE|nr:uncharacterized protein FOMMEDRAFT_136923 [Fomitiporia mediterranea MF3/22]EJC98732.1 hypothetical protein FOMMEDRAFT_136923 [Fomitiporia mediterranea MF3/22]